MRLQSEYVGEGGGDRKVQVLSVSAPFFVHFKLQIGTQI